jgi:hypothetical protein
MQQAQTEYSATLNKEETTVTVKAAGTCPTSGYGFSINPLRIANVLNITITVLKPSHGATVTKGFTFPEHQEEIDIPEGCKQIQIKASDKSEAVDQFNL